MFIEQFVSNQEAITILRNSLSSLNRINFFAVMLEVAARRAKITAVVDKPVEVAALQGAWHAGYAEALNDMYHFIDNIAEKKEQAVVDFGALKALLDAKEITPEEYERLRAERTNTK